MTNIFEITDWSHVASFFVWTLAVCAIAKALFGSLPVAELQYRLSLRDAPRRQRMNRLNWEINNRAKWDEDVTRRSPHAAPVRLTDDEVESRRGELQRLTRASLPWRALQYLLACWACQTFWTAALIYAVTAGVTAPAAWLFSAAAYSAAAVLMPLLQRTPQAVLGFDPQAARTGCKNCGK